MSLGFLLSLIVLSAQVSLHPSSPGVPLLSAVLPGAESFSSLSSACRWRSPEVCTPDPQRRPPGHHAVRRRSGHTAWDTHAARRRGAGAIAGEDPGRIRVGGRRGLLALVTALEPHKGQARGAGLSGGGSLRHAPCHPSVPHSFLKVPTACWALVGAGCTSVGKKTSCLPGSQSQGRWTVPPRFQLPHHEGPRPRFRPGLLLGSTDVRP